MRKQAAMLVLFWMTVPMFAGDTTPAAPAKTFKGEITDSQCGFNIHSNTRSHMEMLKTGTMGKSGADCARACVRGYGGVYVFVSADKKEAYKLQQQDMVSKFGGQKVTIEGALDKNHKMLHINTIGPLEEKEAKVIPKEQ